MRWTISTTLLTIMLILLLGCGVSYRATIPEDITNRPDRFQNRRVEISGVPELPRKSDFAPPSYFHKGYWSVIVDGQVCVEEINFENENRVIACRRLAKKAASEGRKITIKGEINDGFVDMELFEGISTNTPWYKDQRPDYHHPTYLYNWGGYRPYYWWAKHYYGLSYGPPQSR